MTQDELAALLGVSGAAISQWERSVRTPDGDTLVKLADIFECSVDYLLGRIKSKQPLNATLDKDAEGIRFKVDPDGVDLGVSVEDYVADIRLALRSHVTRGLLTQDDVDRAVEQFRQQIELIVNIRGEKGLIAPFESRYVGPCDALCVVPV